MSISCTAGKTGGGLEGRPRQSIIFRIASGGFTAQRIRIRPPHSGHFKTSNSNTRSRLDDWDREIFLVIHLDTKNQIIDICTASIGSLSASITHPREIWCYAVRNQSAAVIFVHNHPSGEATPSHEDKDCTDRLVKAGQILGIRVLDHLIIGSYGNYFSFAEAGLLQSSS